MLLEIAIISSSLIGGITAITLASLSFVKKHNKEQFDLDKAEIDFDQSKIDAQIALAKQKQDFEIKKEQEDRERLNPKPSRFESLQVIDSKFELRECPYCKHSNTNKSFIPNGKLCYGIIEKKGPLAIVKELFGEDVGHGPSSSFFLFLKGKHYLWQCCTRCIAEWLLIDPKHMPPPLKKDKKVE